MSSSSANDDEEFTQESTNIVDHVAQAQKMLDASERRKEAKRKAIEAQYRQRVEKARSNFLAFHAAHTAKVADAQATQFLRLKAALHKRQVAEMAIWKCIQRIDASKNNLAELLAEVYNTRLEMMTEISTTGRVPDKVA